MTEIDPTSKAPGPRSVALALLRYFPHGGLQRIALECAEALAQRGHKVTLFTQEWLGPRPETVEVEILPARGLSNHARAASFGAELKSRLLAQPVDVTLGFDRLPGLDLYFAADPCYSARLRRDRGPLHRWTPRARAFLRLERDVFGTESPTRVLLMSGAEQAVIQSEYGTPSSRFAVLPPGFSSSRRRGDDAPSVRARTRAELGLQGLGLQELGLPERDEDALLLLALGSDFHRKGFDRALRAIHHLAASDPSRQVWLAIAGDDDPAGLRALSASLSANISTAVHVLFLGARDDVPALLQAADLLIHPCRSEFAGMVILEALSAGTPVLTAACAGYAEHVQGSGAGTVVPEPFRQDALNSALEQLAQSPLAPLRDRAIQYMKGLDPGAMVDAVVREVEEA